MRKKARESKKQRKRARESEFVYERKRAQERGQYDLRVKEPEKARESERDFRII